jgi:RNA polymerase sigma-70 factor, ECF subfamily
MRSAVLNPRTPRLLTLVAGREANDHDVARALIAGEAWASAETWHRMAPMVFVMLERCLGSRAEAEDLTQDVFCRVFRKASTLRDPDSLRSFVYSFAIRVLKTELRKRKLRAWLPLETVPDLRNQVQTVESRDLLRKLYVLLDRLSTRDRLVFVLRRMESMTVDEIATHMDLSTSTVKRSIVHASSRLSQWADAEPELAELLAQKRMDP